MTSRSALISGNPDPFELKGSLFTLTVLHLRHPDLEAIDRLLADKVRQAPGFFQNAPVVVDLDGMAATAIPDCAGLCRVLRERGLIPVGVRNGNAAQQQAALAAGLALLPEGRSVLNSRKPSEPTATQRNRLVTQPVRSGQQIYAAEGDLILLGAVSPGAEVLADGNIHVYGPLRGRALAGIKGDTRARIFCQSLEAELVSIAGHYRVIEELEAEVRGRSVQIFLADERLVIEPLSR